MKPLLCLGVPAEDGILLATDVYLPDGPGPFPVIAIRTPYHRTGHAPHAADGGNATARFLEHGYAVVAQDCRGKYDSEGEFVPLVDEGRDGAALLDWTADQRWCSGRIGMWGRSYPSIVQVPAAASGHEALRCLTPSVSPASFFHDWIRHDGCFALANTIRWSLTHTTCRNQPPLGHLDWAGLCRSPDIAAIEERAGLRAAVLADWARRDVEDEFWQGLDQTGMYSKIMVPAFHSGGWFDHLTRGIFQSYSGIRDRGASESARNSRRLIVGPWGHPNIGNTGPEHTRYGDWEFGSEADLSILSHELQFLDFHLRDIDQGYTAQPRVKAFLMGANRWLRLEDWPPPAQEQVWYLHSEGSANGRIGDGVLTHQAPSRDRSDSYRYDPRDPVPTLGGPIYWGLPQAGPVDQRPVLERHDVLMYRSERLPNPLAVMGDVRLDLVVTTEGQDTDFIAKLCVEEASGAVICLAAGSLRCRYRQSWQKAEPMESGVPTAIGLHLGQIGYLFPAGSRVVLTVTSSDFPRIEPHNNTMAPPLSGARPQVATNAVLHGPETRSCLRLPVMEGWE